MLVVAGDLGDFDELGAVLGLLGFVLGGEELFAVGEPFELEVFLFQSIDFESQRGDALVETGDVFLEKLVFLL